MNPAEQYILEQPQPYRAILLHVCTRIEYTVPDVALRYKYKIPFYYFNAIPFCYLNVNYKKGFVDVGFWKAKLLTQDQDHMVTAGRKMIKSLRYTTLKTIDDSILTAVLCEAKSLYDM